MNNETQLRTIDGKLCRRMEVTDTYAEGDYALDLRGFAVPVKHCIGRRVNKAELGHAWTPREHTPESFALAKARERGHSFF